MRGPWRGGNLPFIPCKKRKKKEEKENTRRASFTAFRDVRRHPVVSRKEKKEEINLRSKMRDIKIYIYVRNMIIYIYIYIIHVYAIRSRFSSERSIPVSCKRHPLYVRRPFSPSVQSKVLSCLPAFLPPSLPPEESSRALPILQYLYFSMLKPRYIINYIKKLRSPVISRMNVTC